MALPGPDRPGCRHPVVKVTVSGLPVAGYRSQSSAAIATVNSVKEIEEHVLRLLDEISSDGELAADKRWLAIGRTDIERGFMAVNRSVFKPKRAAIGDDKGSGS